VWPGRIDNWPTLTGGFQDEQTQEMRPSGIANLLPGDPAPRQKQLLVAAKGRSQPPKGPSTGPKGGTPLVVGPLHGGTPLNQEKFQ